MAKGFTLVELVIVLILVGILSTGVYLSWPKSVISLEAEANRIAQDIRFTQSLSMAKGERYRFVKTGSNTYQITNSAGTAIALAGGSTTVTLGSGITFGTLTNLPNSLIVFNTQGIPYTDTGSPGTQLASTAIIPIVGGSDSETISITPQTGRVIVQ